MKRKNRTVIFMTNNVEEAEKVGDRIVILNEAEVQIKGTLKHIRRQFRKFHLFFFVSEFTFFVSFSQKLSFNIYKNARN